MDLSTAVGAMLATGASSSNSGAGGVASSTTSGAVACPVCTLYLREGISLQKHLDTHPKEQVIEALIRASSSGSGASGLFGSTQPQTLAHPPPPTTPTPAPAPTPTPTPTPTSNSNVQPTPSPSPHVPHPAQSPYPIGPIFECPPINTMMPPQFASFSYQQFVNNGTMMIPAQYAMAQAQAPQTNQMMQMLYNPYGMYHQQQIPTVQMISAPPMMPTSTATLPTPLPAAITSRIRPSAPSMSNVSTSVNEATAPTSPQQSVPTSPPRPVMTSCTQQQQMQPQSQQVAIESPKMQVVQEIIPGPERILPDLEAPTSPEPTQIVAKNEEDSSAHLDHREQQTQNERIQEQEEEEETEERYLEQYQSVDPPTLLSNTSEDNTEDDKTERILPEIEDNQDTESLLLRDSIRVEAQKDSEMPLAESETVEPMEISILEEITNKDVVETKLISEISSHRELEENEIRVEESEQIVQECQSSPQDLSFNETRTSNKSEIEQISRLLVNIESEFSNVDLSSKVEDENSKDHREDVQDVLSVEPQDKHIEEDESTSISYRKTPEPIECKIIVAHDDTDVSSVASSSDSMQCDMEIQKIETSLYHYKYSQSAPTTPRAKKKFYRSLSRVSLRSDFGHSNENICSYPVGFEATTLQDYLKDNYNDEDMELEEPHHSFLKQSGGIIVERARSQTPVSTSMSGVSVLKARRSKIPCSPVSMLSASSYCQLEEDEEDSDVESCASGRDEKDDYDEEEEEDGMMGQQMIEDLNCKDKKETVHKEVCKTILASELVQQQTEAVDFRSQTLMAEHYSMAQFPLEHHVQQQQSIVTTHNETYPLSNSAMSQNLLNISECADPTTSTDSKSYSSSNKSTMQKPSTELLNINEDAHAGPINVFEFDGLQILVPSTFISESSQKAVSGTSQQSMSSSENGVGNDEEVKSVNMRADETMPARGELSEQESNGCTEQSAWQLYMGQESSRMSTSYDLMARESWEDSEGSDHDDNNGVPLLDSRSLATQFTSSLFLDRDRKTPTRRIFKCSQCPKLFECPKERRVHSTTEHKEAGPSGYSNDNIDHSEPKDIKLLEGRANVFDDLFVPNALHAQQQLYHHLQQPLLHQLQPPQHIGVIDMKGDAKLEALHMSTVAEVICSLCNQRFTSEKSLQIHHRRMHVAEPAKRVRENAKCQICNEEFTSVASFNFHLKVHPLECGQCGKYFYRKQNFKLHMKRHLGIKPFPCTLCDKAFLTKQKLDEHTNGHTGNAPVKCNLCSETFRRYSNLTQHKNRHHLNIKKKLKDYICHCGEVFHTKKKLAWHKETHDEKPKACSYCNERFIHMASLTRHMRRAHNKRFVPDAQRENENVECPICKSIYLRSSLAVHMRVHNGEKPYECQICSKTFSTKWNLQLHKWTHAPRSTKPYKCSQCSAAFYRHSDYTAHVNSHRNVRPYTCNYCGAQFIRKYNCLRHVKEHEENKSYTCDVCNKTFHRSYYLKEHKRVHTGQRPYTCHICGKSSSTKSNHNKHVRIHHAREPVNTEN